MHLKMSSVKIAAILTKGGGGGGELKLDGRDVEMPPKCPSYCQ